MRSLLRAVLAVVTGLSLSACLEVKSVLTVNKDGTATIEETALASAQLKALFSGGQPAGGGADNPGAGLKDMLPDKAKAEERAKELGEGVTVKSHEEVNLPDGRGGVKVTYAVADINKLKYDPFEGKNKQDGGTSRPMTFSMSGDTLTITNPDDGKPEAPAADTPKPSKEEMQAQMAVLKPIFAGMRMSMVVKGGTGIASTNATHFEGDTVTLVDMQIDKLLDNPEQFGQFMEASEKNLSNAQAAEIFKGVDGIKFEGKNTVTIKVK